MASLAATIKQLREINKLTQDELGKRLSISRQTVNNYEHGRREPDIEMLNKMAAVFSVPVEVFVAPVERQQRFFVKPPVPERLTVAHRLPVKILDYTPGRSMVPIVGSVRCGVGGLAYQDMQGSEVADVPDPRHYFWLRVEGDSMAPAIQPGDLALVRVQQDVDNGQLAVVIIDDEEGVLKRFKQEGSTVILQSFNPAYEPRVFVGEEIKRIRIAGRVVETKKKW